MGRTAQDVTKAELSILHCLWEQGPITTRRITDAFHPEATASQYATVQKLLERLELKGYVVRDRSCWPHVFTATVDKEELIGRRLRAVAENLCGGSLTPLLTHLLKVEGLSRSEYEELRSFMKQLDTRKPFPNVGDGVHSS